MRTTLHPRPSRSAHSRCEDSSEPPLPPSTMTSGNRRAKNSRGDEPSNSTTQATAASAARISARSADGMIGRGGPCLAEPLPGVNRALAAASLSMATIRTSPSDRACSRRRIWPGCSRSKQPLAHTTPFPARFHWPRREISSLCETTCPKPLPVSLLPREQQKSQFYHVSTSLCGCSACEAEGSFHMASGG